MIHRQLVLIDVVGKAADQLVLLGDAGVLVTGEIADVDPLIAGLKLPKLVIPNTGVVLAANPRTAPETLQVGAGRVR